MHLFSLAIDVLYCAEAELFIEGNVIGILCFKSDFVSLCRQLFYALVYQLCCNTLALMSLVNEYGGYEICVLRKNLFRLKVAEKLKSVARSKQVLCVTHLPQLAAMGDTHLLIAKGERNGRTYTTVTPLNLEGRKRELARIIGGANITETTLKSAEEMLRS